MKIGRAQIWRRVVPWIINCVIADDNRAPHEPSCCISLPIYRKKGCMSRSDPIQRVTLFVCDGCSTWGP